MQQPNFNQHHASSSSSSTVACPPPFLLSPRRTRPQLHDPNAIFRKRTNIDFGDYRDKMYSDNDDVRKETIIKFQLKDDELIECRRSNTKTPKQVFPFHVKPYTNLKASCCKFKTRGCLLKSWKLYDPVIRDAFNATSPIIYDDITMFSVPVDKVKNNITVADTKLLKCYNPKCSKVDEDGKKIDTVFHYCCYVNMKEEHRVGDIVYDKDKDNLFSEDEKKMLDQMNASVVGEEIILPFCQKHCYNQIMKLRDARPNYSNVKAMRKKNAQESIERNSMLRWDSDSRNGSFTSEEVIVNWLTDAENAEKYFGGTHGPNSKVNGHTKDVYHNYLSKLIRETNGK